jgi:hypothetical protein
MDNFVFLNEDLKEKLQKKTKPKPPKFNFFKQFFCNFFLTPTLLSKTFHLTTTIVKLAEGGGIYC